jgi:hypothetical protein
VTITAGRAADRDRRHVLQIVRARILALLRRKRVIADDTVTADGALAESEPALAELADSEPRLGVPSGRVGRASASG